MRGRASTHVGWGAALWAAVLVGCTGGTEPALTPAQIGAPLAVTPGVPQEFPRMLGCAAEELGNPTDPGLRLQLKRICDVAQQGLYALEQDSTLTDDEKVHTALMLMGVSLERMTQLLAAADAATADAGTSTTDAGIQP